MKVSTACYVLIQCVDISCVILQFSEREKEQQSLFVSVLPQIKKKNEKYSNSLTDRSICIINRLIHRHVGTFCILFR